MTDETADAVDSMAKDVNAAFADSLQNVIPARFSDTKAILSCCMICQRQPVVR